MIFQPGDLFDHYAIHFHIAQGGTGDVYRAEDVLTGQTVALKIPTKAALFDLRQYDYFLRELEAIRSLQHPAVQRYLESGRHGNTPFLATEFLQHNPN